VTRPAHVPPLPERFAGMSDAELLAALPTITEDLAGARAREKQLLQDRLAILWVLSDHGVTHREMAGPAGVAAVSIAYSLRAPDRKRPAKKAKPKVSRRAGS
jgi:hypothetical protein